MAFLLSCCSPPLPPAFPGSTGCASVAISATFRKVDLGVPQFGFWEHDTIQLADDIIAEEDRLALAILFNEYDDIREEWAPEAPDISREELMMRYKRRREESFGMHPPR